MITLKLVDRMPFSNPDVLLIEATFSGNAAAPGVGDAMDLTKIEDPELIGGPYPSIPPTTPLMVLSENLGGNYVQPTLGSTMQNFTLRTYQANGTEIPNGQAYPAAMTEGFVLLGLKLSQI